MLEFQLRLVKQLVLFGALILGDAAVTANIVSPVLIIIVAITGISSFAIPDFSLSFHCRLLRFAYIILGYFSGFLGIAFCFVAHISILASINSFGVSYLSPYAPISRDNSSSYFLPPLWKREERRSFLHAKKPMKEEQISKQWKY